MNEWQPIETAPLDGTEILLLQKGKGCYGDIDIGSWQFIEISDSDGTDIFDWVSNYGHIEEPTNWMPLPKPPKN